MMTLNCILLLYCGILHDKIIIIYVATNNLRHVSVKYDQFHLLPVGGVGGGGEQYFGRCIRLRPSEL